MESFLGICDEECLAQVVAWNSYSEGESNYPDQQSAHYPEFLHLVLDRNETHMGTRTSSSADC